MDNEIIIDNDFLDFMQKKYKAEHKNEETITISAPIFKRNTKYKSHNLPDLIDELRVRKEPYFVNIYNWLYQSFGSEYEAFRKEK